MKVVKEGTGEPLEASGTVKEFFPSESGDKDWREVREMGRRNEALIGVLGGVGNWTGSMEVETTAKVRSATYSKAITQSA
jgi:hypothetical protein